MHNKWTTSIMQNMEHSKIHPVFDGTPAMYRNDILELVRLLRKEFQWVEAEDQMYETLCDCVKDKDNGGKLFALCLVRAASSLIGGMEVRPIDMEQLECDIITHCNSMILGNFDCLPDVQKIVGSVRHFYNTVKGYQNK